MKCLGDGTRVRIVSSVKRSILSSTKRPATRIPNSKRLFRSSALAAGIALSVLLVGLTLSPSMRGMFTRGGSVAAFTESINLFGPNDCQAPATSLTVFTWGDTVCATVTGAPFPNQRRIVWVAPNGLIAQQTQVTSDPQTDTFSLNIPVGDRFRQTGTWTVKTINSDADGVASATFVVHDTTPKADLSISKSGPTTIRSGDTIQYTVFVYNAGPDAAENVRLTEPTPNDTVFNSESQDLDLGPAFTCDGTGPRTCTILTLAPGAQALFTFNYNVNSLTPVGTVISNTATVFSDTSDPRQVDNSSTATATVTGTGGTPCTITCPPSQAVNNNTSDPNPCVRIVTYLPATITGNCVDPDTGQTPTVACSPPSGAAFPVGTTSVTCAAGSVSCSFTVTVNDTRSLSQLTINCPAHITVNENPAQSGSAVVNYSTPNTTGNCVTVTCNPPSGSIFLAGNTTVNCTATDSSNNNPNTNTASCNFLVTVNTSTCELDCPDDKTVNESAPGSGSATVTYSSAIALPTCPTQPPLTITCTPSSGSTFFVGLTQVNCTGKDQSNNVVATCSFAVTVNSIPRCTITCPASLIRNEFPTGSGSATVTYVPPPTTATCLTVSCNPASGSVFPVGTTTVNCTGTDATGNTNSCSFTVTVTGGTPCVITCPSTFVIGASSGCGNTVTYANPTTTGPCGDPNDPTNPNPWSCSPPSGSFFPVGMITVTCSTDVGTECSFAVTIPGTDAVKPVITSCATPTFALADSNCQGVVPNVTSDVDATDNCTPTNLLTITQNPLPGTVVGIGTTSITITVKDANNNSSLPCMTTFEVFELTPPIALCKPFTVALDATGNASIIPASVDNGSSDNCGITSRTVTPSTFTCANKGANTVTLTVTDGSGNSASCQTTVTVIDNRPPTITCPNNIVQSTDPNQCTAVVTYSNATAADNCPNVGTPACSPASGSTFPKGTTTVNCTVSDASSNSASCSFTVTVKDTQPPSISCSPIPGNLTFEPTCPAGAVVTYSAPVASDNCGVLSVVCIPASGSTFAIGTTTVNCTATDTAIPPNTNTCSFTVTVKTARAVIVDLISRVQALINQGVLNAQTGQGLISKLQAAIDGLDKGNTNIACNKLDAFINEVQNDIQAGKLTSAQGQPLITSAANAENTLGCTNLPCS